MKYIPITITAFSSADQPGWVDCQIIDTEGVLHQFVEKVPVVSEEDLWGDSTYPRDGIIACEVIETGSADDGRLVTKITTSNPWGIESKTGDTEFVVYSDQLQDTNDK